VRWSGSVWQARYSDWLRWDWLRWDWLRWDWRHPSSPRAEQRRRLALRQGATPVSALAR
jgi:hypothetical protein